MRQPIVLQVEGLGIPVVISDASAKTELRWSSDPDIKADAAAYLFHDSKEIHQFLTFAVDKRFINENLLLPIRVTAPEGAISLPRAEAEAQGVDAQNWELVRVGLIINGNSNKGPVSDALEWVGDREEYADSKHMLEAYQHASHRGITNPIIVTHNEAHQTLAAAEFMTVFHHSIKPQLMNAHQVLERLTSELTGLEVDTLNPDRAVSILKQIKYAFDDAHEQDNILRMSLGMEPKPLADLPAQAPKSQPSSTDAPVAAPAPEPEPSPELFRSPRMG
jgi:hypothetical protein